LKTRTISLKRETKETTISLTLALDESGPQDITTDVPFFSHLLHAMSFHGGFGLTLTARGDVDIDAHHLVEDTGLVLGDALKAAIADSPAFARYGHAVIPMDDALAEAAVDVSGRPTLVYRARYPQALVGSFQTALIREFLTALVQRAAISLHALIRSGENSHHMAEALFKALGKAISRAFDIRGVNRSGLSTKGTLG